MEPEIQQYIDQRKREIEYLKAQLSRLQKRAGPELLNGGQSVPQALANASYDCRSAYWRNKVDVDLDTDDWIGQEFWNLCAETLLKATIAEHVDGDERGPEGEYNELIIHLRKRIMLMELSLDNVTD